MLSADTCGGHRQAGRKAGICLGSFGQRPKTMFSHTGACLDWSRFRMASLQISCTLSRSCAICTFLENGQRRCTGCQPTLEALTGADARFPRRRGGSAFADENGHHGRHCRNSRHRAGHAPHHLAAPLAAGRGGRASPWHRMRRRARHSPRRSGSSWMRGSGGVSAKGQVRTERLAPLDGREGRFHSETFPAFLSS